MAAHQDLDFELEENPEQMNLFLLPQQNHLLQGEINNPLMTGERRRVFIERTAILLAVYNEGEVNEQTQEMCRMVMPDMWSEELEIIHGQVRSQNRITERDESLWKTYSGHWFAKNLDEERQRLNVSSTLTDQTGQEIETDQSERQRVYERTAGPRIFEALQRDSSWETSRLKGIMIGVSVLLFLPFLDTVERVNMGIMGTLIYRTLGHAMTNPISEERDYFRKVLDRLRLIGWKKSLPIYLEFFLSADRNPEHLHSHIMGYMTNVVNIQQVYAGPIVVVLPPVSLLGQAMTETEYEGKKRQNEKLGRLLRMYGSALGVPVWEMFVQTKQHMTTQYFVTRPFFWNKHLFDKQGRVTEEYGDRVVTDFEQCFDIMEYVGLSWWERYSCWRHFPEDEE